MTRIIIFFIFLSITSNIFAVEICEMSELKKEAARFLRKKIKLMKQTAAGRQGATLAFVVEYKVKKMSKDEANSLAENLIANLGSREFFLPPNNEGLEWYDSKYRKDHLTFEQVVAGVEKEVSKEIGKKQFNMSFDLMSSSFDPYTDTFVDMISPGGDESQLEDFLQYEANSIGISWEDIDGFDEIIKKIINCSTITEIANINEAEAKDKEILPISDISRGINDKQDDVPAAAQELGSQAEVN